MIRTMLKSVHVLLCLFPVWNRHPTGSHTEGATERLVIAQDKNVQGICV